MVNYLLDTNVISGFISNKYSEEKMALISNLIDKSPNISIITKLNFCGKTENHIEDLIKELVQSSNVIL